MSAVRYLGVVKISQSSFLSNWIDLVSFLKWEKLEEMLLLGGYSSEFTSGHVEIKCLCGHRNGHIQQIVGYRRALVEKPGLETKHWQLSAYRCIQRHPLQLTFLL